MQTHNIGIKWAPGHTGIEGNEAAHKLANLGASQHCATGATAQPTISGIRSICRGLRRDAQSSSWAKCSIKLSPQYRRWDLDYKVKPLPELNFSRLVLHQFLALRPTHGTSHGTIVDLDTKTQSLPALVAETRILTTYPAAEKQYRNLTSGLQAQCL